MASENPSDPSADASHRSSLSLPGERPPYPWGRCIFRFLKRLFFGTAIYIVLVVGVFTTAGPHGSDGMIILRVSPFLLLLWALAGFLPPGGSWPQRISAGKTAEYAAVATLIAILAGVGFSRLAKLRETETPLFSGAMQGQLTPVPPAQVQSPPPSRNFATPATGNPTQ